MRTASGRDITLNEDIVHNVDVGDGDTVEADNILSAQNKIIDPAARPRDGHGRQRGT